MKKKNKKDEKPKPPYFRQSVKAFLFGVAVTLTIEGAVMHSVWSLNHQAGMSTVGIGQVIMHPQYDPIWALPNSPEFRAQVAMINAALPVKTESSKAYPQ